MISKLILGTVQFGLEYGINNTTGIPSKENVKLILDLAYNNGINLLDTAEAYGDSQKKIGEYHNNSANKFFDTLASGTPVAINYLGWQADIINDSGAGLILPPSDALLSAKKINQAITNKKWLISAGRSAQKIALRDFDRDKLAQKFEKIIVESINDYGSG